MNRVLADALGASQCACAPMRGSRRTGMQRGRHQLSDFGHAEAGLATTAGCDLPNTTDALLAHTPTPPGCGAPPHLERQSNLPILLTGGRRLNDTATQDHLLWC